MKQLLRTAGQRDVAIVIAGMLVGLAIPSLAIPSLADFAHPFLAIAIAIFTFGSLLKFDALGFTKRSRVCAVT